MSFDPITEDQRYFDSDYPTTMFPVKFFSNGFKLLGTFLIAEGEGPHKTIILLHGYPGNETNLDLAHVLRRAGYNVFIFHYRGMWGSEGIFSWSNCLDDVHAAIEFVTTEESIDNYRVDASKIILAGHSMGGFAAYRTGCDYSEINNLISFAGFNFGFFAKLAASDQEYYELSLERMERDANIFSNIKPQKLLDEMITCADNFDLINFAEELSKKNILCITAKYDSLAPAEIHAIPLAKAIRKFNPSKFVDIILDSGHSFSNSRIKLSRAIVNWLNKITF